MATISIDTAAKILQFNVGADIPTFIWGAPGIGKSQLVHQTGRLLKRKVIDFRASLRDPVDMRGLPFVDEKTGLTRWLCPNELPREDRDGEFGILFLDELNVATQAMQAACFGLVLERQLAEYKLPKGWIPVAAGNRMQDRAAGQRMPTALRNRFAHITIEPDLNAWCAWAKVTGVDPVIIAFVKYRPELLHKMPADDAGAFPTPRSWEQCSKAMQASDDIRLHIASSIVGDSAAAELEGFVRVWKSLPSIESILKDPRGTKIPDDKEPSVMYAVATALARRVKKDSFAAAMTYAKRLPKEFEIVFMKDATARDATLKETSVFTAWAVDNQGVLS